MCWRCAGRSTLRARRGKKTFTMWYRGGSARCHWTTRSGEGAVLLVTPSFPSLWRSSDTFIPAERIQGPLKRINLESQRLPTRQYHHKFTDFWATVRYRRDQNCSGKQIRIPISGVPHGRPYLTSIERYDVVRHSNIVFITFYFHLYIHMNNASRNNCVQQSFPNCGSRPTRGSPGLFRGSPGLFATRLQKKHFQTSPRGTVD